MDYVRMKLAELEREDDPIFAGIERYQRARLDELYPPESDEADIAE